jgi:hypothetical protein
MYRTGYHPTIAMNWRGMPLVDLNTFVSLIGSTHSRFISRTLCLLTK